jgi:Protein of unknown function (DUF1460)
VKRKWKVLGLGIGYCIVGILTIDSPWTSSRSTQAIPNQSQARSTALPAPVTLKLDAQDRQKIDSVQKKFKTQNWFKLPIGDRIQKVALEFLGEPYRANLLDQTSTEQPFISFHEFDCILFVETVLALTTTLSELNTPPPDNIIFLSPPTAPPIESLLFEKIERYRYRDQTLEDYCSRLHYFSEWILDNQRRGWVVNQGTVPLKRSINFMTQNWQKYSPIVKNNSLKTCIQTAEVAITKQLQAGMLKYVPIGSLRDYEPNLQAGDIIGIVTNTPGLDVTHSGFLYRNGQSPAGLLHASGQSGIKISPNLERYVRGVDGAIGIVIARHRN